MWINVDGIDIFDFDGCRRGECFRNVGNNGVDEWGVNGIVTGAWEKLGFMNVRHRRRGPKCGNLWARLQGLVEIWVDGREHGDQIETLINQIPVREAENGVDHDKMKTSVPSAGGDG